ncbi:hypothetical protein DNTS_014643 [Danionella cerebrum]|uniref:RING-type domain-containing protein n=1 Tax=Danionella cerebrum TaxID=2873325 RepID=A0A553R8L1_9TELE|nr:hypothetical protein DNTS_014643 [Danionella translucida]
MVVSSSAHTGNLSPVYSHVPCIGGHSVTEHLKLGFCSDLWFCRVCVSAVHSRVGPRAESYILSSDEEDEESGGRLSPGLLTSLQSSSQARSAPVSVSCPVCMDIYSEIIDSGRLMVSTKCGHLFCSQCIRDSLSRAHSCPTCRKKLTYKQYHPIYI